MVGGRRVVVLDDDGRPIRRDASLRQFNSFAEGPCPVLEALVAATPAGAQVDAPSQFGMADPSANSRPVLRAHSRVRDGIVP